MTALGHQILCGVCGAPANGKYFGAFVCLPCKTFFIRCTSDDLDPLILQCRDNYTCDVSAANRATCKSCRYRKCLNIGMARKERPESVRAAAGQQLCAVCGDIANGIHFGAITCEGCKKFFRRGQKEFQTYSCKAAGNCYINPRTRNACRYCRYRKCVTVGMSRQGIRMGRPSKSQQHFMYKNHQVFCDPEALKTSECRSRTYSNISATSSSNSDDNFDDVSARPESHSYLVFPQTILREKPVLRRVNLHDDYEGNEEDSAPVSKLMLEEKIDVESIVQLLKAVRIDYLKEFEVANKFLETKFNSCCDLVQTGHLPPNDLQTIIVTFLEDIIQLNTKLEVSMIKLLIDCTSLSKDEKYSVIKYGGPLLRFLALAMECWVPHSQTFRHCDFWMSCLSHQDPAWKDDMMNLSRSLCFLQLNQAERAILLATTLLAVDAFIECPAMVQLSKDKVARCWALPWMSYDRQEQLLGIIPEIVGFVKRYYHQAESFLFLQANIFQGSYPKLNDFADVPLPPLVKT